MKRSSLIRQIIICVIIVIICAAAAFLVKGYFINSEEKELVSPTDIKDKYEYNEYQLVNVTTEMLIQRYFVDFKDKLLTSTEEAYKLLDEDSKAMYESYNDFKKFVEQNDVELRTSYITKYTAQKKGKKNVYTIVDQFNRKYTFTAKAVLVYEVNLQLGDETPSIFE